MSFDDGKLPAKHGWEFHPLHLNERSPTKQQPPLFVTYGPLHKMYPRAQSPLPERKAGWLLSILRNPNVSRVDALLDLKQGENGDWCPEGKDISAVQSDLTSTPVCFTRW